VVATGTPEQVARNPHSHTGRYLARVLANNHNGHNGNNGIAGNAAPSDIADKSAAIVEKSSARAEKIAARARKSAVRLIRKK
jgi:hypothetical protein